MINPYVPPDSVLSTTSRRYQIGPSIGLVVGSLLLICLLGSLGYIVFLYTAYPGLTDSPSAPVDYWPEVAVFIHQILAGTFAVVGVPTFWLSWLAYRRHRTDARGGTAGLASSVEV